MPPDDTRTTLTGHAPHVPIGRDALLGDLRSSIEDVRAMTLVGPGGVGKTTLLRALAGGLTGDAWRVAWTDLTSVTDVGAMAARVAHVLEAVESRDELLEAAIDRSLARRPTLLVLDNAEDVVAPGSWIVERLAATSSLVIRATSRRPLGFADEVVEQVRGLAGPSDARPESIRTSPAGQLFLERAAAGGRRLDLAGTAGADVAALLDRLDGLPLAIELAARRTRIMTPRSILERLDAADLLADRSRVPARHSSLRAALHWSLGTLTPAQQELLAAISAWIGRFEIDAVELVAPGPGVLDDLDALVDLGLVQVLDDEGAIGFRVLETVRDAIDPAVRAAARQRLAWALAHRLDAWATRLGARRPDEQAAFLRGRPTIETLVAELGAREPASAALVVAAAPYWLEAGALRQPLEACRAATAADDTTTAVRAWLAVAALETVLFGGLAGADAARHALRLARDVAQPELELAARYRLASILLEAGEDDAERQLRVGLALARRLGRHRDAIVLRHRLADRGQRARTVVPVLESLVDAARASEDPDVLAAILNGLAANELFLGRDDPALSHADEAATTYRHLGSPLRATWASLIGAAAAAHSGRLALAMDLLRAAGPAALEGAPPLQVFYLVNAVPLLSRLRIGDIAARAVGARDGHFARTGQRNTPDEDAWWEGEVDAARATVTPLRWHVERLAGVDAPPGAVVAAVLSSLAGAPGRSVRESTALTPREVEVLGLVGRGLSDAQIAQLLFISPKTASVHVSNIKGKLEVGSRLEAAIRARELGLVAPAR